MTDWAALSGITMRELIQRVLEHGLRSAAGTQTPTPGRHAPPPVITPPRGVPIPAVLRATLRRLEEEKTRPGMPDLLDVSVWLPLSAPDHV